MGFFDRFSPEERRWRREAKEEAEDYRREARNLLSEAKDVYDDYKEMKGESQRAANELNNLLRNYNSYKADVLKELSGDINISIENFKRFNISNRVALPSNFSTSAPSIASVNVSSMFSSMPGASFNPINIALSVFSDPYKDRDKAMDQKYAAQEYLYKVQDALNDMQILYRSLNNSQRYIEDEKSNLAQLMEKVRKIISQLNAAMNRNSFTEKEARYMTGISKIADKIKSSLEQRIISNSGDIDSNYKLYSGKIKDINNLIPAAPTVSDSSNWLDRLLTY
ncbi:MAG: hypothetical protein IJL14_08475 [Selenomonadaceae bacterium]|nr:hypothetical protein [Selenomonadaceae bacterium]